MAAAGGGAGAAAGGAACAACKYHRRRCTPECPLPEFFPHDRPRVFRNAHRLFGVSNILKTLARAGPEKRREAMHCIIYESHAWDVHPARGCLPIIHDLQHRIRQAELDLRRVYAAIHACRAAAAAAAAEQAGQAVTDLDGDPSASAAAQSLQFQFQPAPGNVGDDIAAEAYGGGTGGGVPYPFVYGGDQQHMMMSAAASDDGNIALQMPPWMMQPPQYEMGGKLVPQASQDHHPFLVDATMAAQSPQQQQQPIDLVGPPPGLDDEMSYFADSMDGDDEMPSHQSTSMDSSEKKAMTAPKMEGANGFK